MRNNAALAWLEERNCSTVIHTPSTIGNVESVSAVKPPEILCDWYQGTMAKSIRDAVLDELSKAFGPPAESMAIPSAMRAYTRAMLFSGGATLYDQNRYGDTCCVVLSGSAEPTRHLHLIGALTALGVRATRIDLAFDDRRSLLTLSDIYRATRSENMVSRWQNSRWQERVQNRSGSRVGQGAVIGSKTSSAYLSIYDKGLETDSALEGVWVRWELRLSDRQAKEFVDDFFAHHPDSTEDDLRLYVAKTKTKQRTLCHDDSEISVTEGELTPELVDRFKRLALAALKDRLSFRDRTSATNVSRALVLPWWEQFLEYFDPTADDKIDYSELDEDEAVRLKNQVKSREFNTRQQAEELLTDIYEQHIRPHQPSLSELLRDIPEYEEPDTKTSTYSNDDVLMLVGLLPPIEATVIPFPKSRAIPAECSRDKLKMQGRVIPFASLKKHSACSSHNGAELERTSPNTDFKL